MHQACLPLGLCPRPHHPAVLVAARTQGRGCQSHWLLLQVPWVMPHTPWTPSKHKPAGCSGTQLMSARLFIYAQIEMWGQMGKRTKGETASHRSPASAAPAHSSPRKDSDFLKDERVSESPVWMASRLKKIVVWFCCSHIKAKMSWISKTSLVTQKNEKERNICNSLKLEHITSLKCVSLP